MDDIDKDLIVDIPDTPDRFPARHAANGGKFAGKESTSLTGRLKNPNFTPEENLNRPIVRIKMKNESIHSRGLQIHPPKAPVNSGEEKNEPRNNHHSRLFRKTTMDKNSKDEVRNLFVNKGKAICDEKLTAHNCSKTYGSPLKGKEKVVENSSDYRRSDSATNNGKGVDLSNNSQHITPPRVGGRKRLVRNGCISPQNIATRAQQQQLAENSEKTIEAKPAEQNQAINLAANHQSSVDINEIVSEDNFHDRFKGKRVSNEHDAGFIDLSGSTPRSTHKEAREIGGPSGDLAGCCRELGGWRRTHTNTDDVGSRFSKRQKTELPLRNSAAMGSGDSGIVFLDSSGRSSSSSSSMIRSHQPWGPPAPIVNIDDLSPAERHSDAQAGQMSNYESDARMRQLEADEALARELQEQLYGEATILGGSEIDENIAWSLQQEEDVARAPSIRNRQAPRPRTVSRTQANRHPSSRTTGIQARAPTRRSNLRSRILGRSRAPPATLLRDVQFPLDMDLDMRIDMLEALEAAVGGPSGVGTANHILQIQRDFNENDYEMLLALDDNNHQHGGASTNLINNLPESTVQTENYEECAVCLETPTIGETIRHLPCLHKFHKECIDLWLVRKTSCPVCKSSIT